MNIVILKLALTPVLIGAVSMAGRRWGQAIGGWLVGLPLTSGPVVLILALASGTAFATTASASILSAMVAYGAFCLAYAWLARHWRWHITLPAAILVFLGGTALSQAVTVPLGILIPADLATLVLALWLMPPTNANAKIPSSPRWDLPARMIVATTFVLLLTGFSTTLGPRLTGLLTPFPLYGSILAAFAHQQQGAEAAARVLHGLLLGLFAFVGFFTTLAIALVPLGIGGAFALAISLALIVQTSTLALMRRDE
jgi:hypothetical protein